MHRLRIGAIGLACVFLLVMLATAFVRMADGGDAGLPENQAEMALNAAETPSEPLAELGLAPGNPSPDPTQPHAPPPPAR